MSKVLDLYLDHQLMDGMEWSTSTEEILGGAGRATFVLQDRLNVLEPRAHMDVQVRVTTTGWNLFRGEVITFGSTLSPKFPWRRWTLNCSDYNGQLAQRNVGALDGATWVDADGMGDFVNVDPYANSLVTDRLTVQQLLDHYIRVDGQALDSDAFVGEYLANFGPIYWTYTNLQAVLEELASYVTQNLQLWIDPDLFFHWTTIPAWQDLTAQAAAALTGDTGDLSRLFPELSGCKVVLAPANLSDEPAGGEVSHADLDFTFDGATMPQQVYVKGGTGYVYNNGTDPLAVDPPIGTPSGQYLLTFNYPTLIYPPAGTPQPVCWPGKVRPAGAAGYTVLTADDPDWHSYSKGADGYYNIVHHSGGQFSAWVGPAFVGDLSATSSVSMEKILNGVHTGLIIGRFASNPKTTICPTGQEPQLYGTAGQQVYVDAVAVPPNLTGVSGTFWVIKSGDRIGWLVPWVVTTQNWWQDSWGAPPAGATGHISLDPGTSFCRYFLKANGDIDTAEVHTTGGFSAYVNKIGDRAWPSRILKRNLAQIMNGNFKGWWIWTKQATSFVQKSLTTTSNITVIPVPGSGGGTDPGGPTVGVGGSGWTDEVVQDPNLRQGYLEAPSSTTRPERDATGGQALYRGRYETVRGTAKVRGVDGWRVGQLVKITDARLPSSLNGRYFVVQRVAASLIPTQDIREYQLDWGDGPVARHSQKPIPKSPTPPPANRVIISVFDLAPEPGASQVITGQLTSPSGAPWAIAGKLVEWSLQVFDKDGNEVLGQGLLTPLTSLTDSEGKARTTFTSGATIGLVYYVFADSPVE